MKLFLFLLLCLAGGCTTFTTEATRSLPQRDTNAPPIIETVKSHGATLGGGQQALQSIAASTGTRGMKAGASGVDQTSTLADLVELLKAIGALVPK